MPVAVGAVKSSSALSLASSSSFIDDASSASQTFNDVLDKAANSAAQKSSDDNKPAAKTNAPAAPSAKSVKKTKPSKARKNDQPDNTSVDSKTPTNPNDAPDASTADSVAAEDTASQVDQTTTTSVTETIAQDQTPNDAEAQLAAYAASTQSPIPDQTPKPIQQPGKVTSKDAPKVQPTPEPKVISTVQHADADASHADESTTLEAHPNEAPVKADAKQQAPDDAAKSNSDPAQDSVQDIIDRLSQKPAQPVDNTPKPQSAPKPVAPKPPVFGQSILRDTQVDVASTKTPGSGDESKSSDAPAAQVSQPIDADSLISVTESKGRGKLAADDQNDARDPAFDPAPAAPQKLEHAPLAPIDKPAEVRFAETNHPEIVNNIRGQLLPNGGSMQLRLDPPDLGRLDVTVTVRDGVMSAAFATANDQATRLLSHSLGQLKTALESAGVTVEKLQVQQSPKSQGGDTSDAQQQQARDHQQDPSAQQEQHRKELLEKMWERISMGSDDVDIKG